MKILAAAAQVEIRVPSDRDCCVYARAVLERAYGSEVVRRVPLARWHLWADTEGVGPWEPVLAAIDAGIGAARDVAAEGLAPRRWHLCQGWRGPIDPWPAPPTVSGHTWLYYAIDVDLGLGLVLDSTRGRGPEVHGLVEWADAVRPFGGGVAVAALTRPPNK